MAQNKRGKQSIVLAEHQLLAHGAVLQEKKKEKDHFETHLTILVKIPISERKHGNKVKRSFSSLRFKHCFQKNH